MRYRTAPGVIMTSICGRYYLVTSEKTVAINETTAFYWKLLKNGIDENELFEKAVNEFEIEEEQKIRNEMHELIINLCANQLVVGYKA